MDPTGLMGMSIGNAMAMVSGMVSSISSATVGIGILKGLMLGVTTGAIAGGGIGAIIAPFFGIRRVDGMLIGAAMGSVIGGTVGAFGLAGILGTGKFISYAPYIRAAIMICAMPTGFDVLAKMWSRATLRDPYPSNHTPEWTRNKLLEHVLSYSGKEDKEKAFASLAILISLTESEIEIFRHLQETRTINDHPEIVISGATCHSLCYNVISKWQEVEKELGITVPRKSFFTVSKTRYIRQDGYGEEGISGTGGLMASNTHGTIEIKFTDGTTVHLDNGWFGRLGPAELYGNFIFGESNIPSNYTRVYNQDDSLFWNL
jgi:hypothetical protein